jgi:ABC-2 type transport system permease protein
VITVFFTVLGILGACAAVQTISRARQEEAHGTAESVRAAAVGRVRWLADYVVVATCAVVLVMGAAVLAAVAGLASTDADPELYRVTIVTALGQLVAASVFTGIAALVFALLPRATIGTGWALVGVATVLGLFGPLFGMPDWATQASPFAVTPVVSNGDVDARGLWWLVVVAAGSLAAALSFMRRRELASGG